MQSHYAIAYRPFSLFAGEEAKIIGCPQKFFSGIPSRTHEDSPSAVAVLSASSVLVM
jgi:hypothetical protein